MEAHMEAVIMVDFGGVGWYDGDGDVEAVTISSGFNYNWKHLVPRDLTKAEMVMGQTCYGVYPDCNYQDSL